MKRTAGTYMGFIAFFFSSIPNNYFVVGTELDDSYS